MLSLAASGTGRKTVHLPFEPLSLIKTKRHANNARQQKVLNERKLQCVDGCEKDVGEESAVQESWPGGSCTRVMVVNAGQKLSLVLHFLLHHNSNPATLEPRPLSR